jgi:opacity protein-like surface antigen
VPAFLADTRFFRVAPFLLFAILGEVSEMRRLLLSLAVVLVLGAALPADAGSLELRGGAFFPRADTRSRAEDNFDLFQDVSSLYTNSEKGRPVSKADWVGFLGGAQYNFKIARHLELGIGVDGYSRTLDTEYNDYERDDGRPIFQTLKLEIVPISAELRFTTTKRYARVAPFVGVGFDLFYWKYEEFGDFIRFSDASLPVIEDSFIADGVAPGFHLSGGLRFAVTDDIGVVAQGRYQWGSTNMGKGFRDDFPNNKLDLSGATATLGVSFRF